MERSNQPISCGGITMIEDRDILITEYETADFERRLNMYLQFPGLRSTFIRIDQKDLRPEIGFEFRPSTRWTGTHLHPFLASLANSVKRAFGVGHA